MNKDKKNPKTNSVEKKRYEKPEVQTEDMTTVAATCNGSTSGGRKSTASAPDFCAANKLKS